MHALARAKSGINMLWLLSSRESNFDLIRRGRVNLKLRRNLFPS